MDGLGGSNSLVQKWEPVLEGIENDYTRRVTAQLLENQAKQIVSEKLQESGGVTTGSTTVGHLGTFQKFAFPLVRRVYPELVANNIVGVQPMQGPVSQIFYLGNSRFHSTTQQVVYSKYKLTYRGLNNEAIGSRDDWDEQSRGPVKGLDGWGTGQFGGAHGTGSGMDLDGTLSRLSTSGVVSATAGGPSSTFGGKIASWPHANTTMGWTVSGGEQLNLTGIPEIQFHIQQQAVVANTRKMRALWTIEASQDLKAYHNLDLERELTDLLSKELSLEIDREILEDLRMIAYGFNGSDTVGNWKAESLDNGNSNAFGNTKGVFQGVNETGSGGSPDFTPSAFTYGSTPRSNELLNTQLAVDSNVFLVDFTATTGANAGLADFNPRHIGELYGNLLATMNIASQDIYRTTHRGPGTVMITSPLMASFLESSAKLEGGIAPADAPTNMGTKVQYKGKFAGKYDLYVDPLWPEDEILVGYKGSNAMEGGYVYAPYIPIQMLPTVVNPDDFQPRKGLLTRYGKAVITPESRWYRIIRLVGADSRFLTQPFDRIRHSFDANATYNVQ